MLRGPVAPARSSRTALPAAALALALVACGGAQPTELFEATENGGAGGATRVTSAPLADDAHDTTGASRTTRPAAPRAHDAEGAAPDRLGARCFKDGECGAALVCNWRTDTCEAPGPEGFACARDEECLGHLVCTWTADACRPPAERGEACRRDSECASRSCDLRAARCR